MDGGFWDLDVSTPSTLDGVARPVPGDTLPLGLARGVRLSRPKQIDFFQRFMFMPFLPSFASPHGVSVQRVLSFPFTENWFSAVLGQFNIQKFASLIKDDKSKQTPEPSLLQRMGKHLSNKSLYALDFSSELILTPDDTLLLSSESSLDSSTTRKKAVFHHKFANHNLTVEAASPGLFTDDSGNYWDVPVLTGIDLASVPYDSGASYRICVNHNAGSPKQFESEAANEVSPALLPGLCAKSAFSYKKTVDIWRSTAPKLKMVQPYDIFLSNPHISASGIIGGVVSATFGENSSRVKVDDDSRNFKGSSLQARGQNSAILADIFAAVSLSAQHGNFQRPFFDLTKVYTRLDFPCGTKFCSGVSQMVNDIYNSKSLSLEAVEAVCPEASFSVQQQIVGPFSLRVDSGVTLDLEKKNGWYASLKSPVLAVEYALQVLGSAKAVAWYSPEQREFMLELRFFET
jgi:hypothetical protein